MVDTTAYCLKGSFVRLYAGFLLAALLALSGCSDHRQRPSLNITYVANDGFLIECDHQKILVDAPFGGFKSNWYYVPSDSVVNLMVEAKPPFDDIDIIAYTHYHVDHFNAEMAINHLLHNQSGIIVCPRQVDQALAKFDRYSKISDRVRVISEPVDSTSVMRIAGIEVKAIRTPHLPSGVEDELTGKVVDGNLNTEHLEFVFSLGGYIIYHSGDATMDSKPRYQFYGFGQHSIDLAFVPWWDASERVTFRQELIRDVIRPDRIMLMHLVPGPKPIDNPAWQAQIAKQVILPERPLEKWTFGKVSDEAGGEGKTEQSDRFSYGFVRTVKNPSRRH